VEINSSEFNGLKGLSGRRTSEPPTLRAPWKEANAV
jgi:hypothetical protein